MEASAKASMGAKERQHNAGARVCHKERGTNGKGRPGTAVTLMTVGKRYGRRGRRFIQQ